MQNNQMAAMAGMNAAGGPVGGTPMMPNGRPQPDPDHRAQLNTYIYDYFLKNKTYRLAKAMLDYDIPMNLDKNRPYRDNSVKTNGMDGADNAEPLREELPSPSIPEMPENSTAFLLEWWQQFWDIYSAARSKGPKQTPAHQYLATTRQLQQLRAGDPNTARLLMTSGMGNQYRNMMAQGGMANGINSGDLKRTAMNNRNPNNPAMANMQMKGQGMMATNMQRDGSGMDMNGQRPQSPGSNENAPSPNKRPRMEGNNFNGQGMAAGRTQGMPQQPMTTTSAGQPNQMLLAGGMNSGNQFSDFAQTSGVQQKSIEGMNPGIQGSPMSQQGLEGQQDMYAGNAPRMPNQPAGQNQGNHALQDYQMQLMLLEQQNKKRLLMARQEQDNMSGGPHGQAAVGAPAGFAPTMSPQGSRAGGPSPNPNDQIKRGTPKLNQQGLPSSPMPDVSMQPNRNSPVPAFDPGMAPVPQYFGQMAPNSIGMRPPSSHPQFAGGQFTPQQQIDAMRNGPMQNGAAWPRGPPQMMQNQMQPGPMSVAQQRNNPMPPPPAPPADQPGRTQEPSPSQSAAAPPTPQQANKPAPRKKDTKDNKKKPAKKGAATAGATPASEADPPPTPTPSTPITPMNPASFNKPNGQAQQHQQQPSVQAAAVAPTPQPQASQIEAGQPFGNLGVGDDSNFPGMDLDLGNPETFDNFDFESFLHNDGENNGFDLGSGFDFGPTIEANAGEMQ